MVNDINCIGKKCRFCYNADFHDSCYVCTSQGITFLKESFNSHKCTILSEIEIEEQQLENKRRIAEYIKVNQ